MADDGGRDGGLSPVDRRTIVVCQELPDQFTNGDLVTPIKEVTGVASDLSIRKYRKRVVNRIDVELHPDNPDLWVPASGVRTDALAGAVSASSAHDLLGDVARADGFRLDDSRQRRL